MFPLANTGMATAFLRGARGRHPGQRPGPAPPQQGLLPRPGPALHVHSPHGLDVLPGRGARQGPLLLLGAPVHGQQLGQRAQLSPTATPWGPGPWLWGISCPHRVEERLPWAHSLGPQSPGLHLGPTDGEGREPT